MATKKKKAKRGKNIKKGGLFKRASNEAINPTKKFIQNATDDDKIELTETGKTHFETLKKQKFIESMEPPILLDELFSEIEPIKLNSSVFLELEENEELYQGVKYQIKNEENTWLFFEDKAIMLDYALTEELSFSYQANDILKYSPTVANDKIYFVSNKEIHMYSLTEETWSQHSISGEITSSLILVDDFIYIVVDFTRLICLNSNFKEEWSFITEGYLLNTPVMDDALYISSSDGMLYKLDKDGDIIWSFNAKSALETPPLLFENTVIISSMSGKLFFISKEDKEELSTIDLGFHLTKQAVIKNNILYAFNRRFIYKIDLVNYKILDIVIFETSIEFISSLNDYLHVKTKDSKSIILDETFTNVNITNFKSSCLPTQHANFLLSIDESSNLLKTEII